MQDYSEKEIIIKIKNGEIDYYSLIVRRYGVLICRYIETKIQNKEDTEDLVQNVFIKFYQAIDRFDENKPIKPYLFQIVNNELKMFYRSKKPTVSLDEKIRAETEKEILIEDLESYLSILNDKEKEIMVLLSQGYSYQEIATRFKKPLNTVKSIIRRARMKIKVKSYEKK